MLAGANLAATRALAEAVSGTPVIASGGVAAVEEIPALREAGLAGAILGRALYDGRVQPEAALAAARG